VSPSLPGIEPRFDTYTGTDPFEHVMSLNFHRRHLTASQKAIVFAKIARLPHGGDYKSEKFDTEISVSIPTQGEAADLLNVGKRSVERARTVLEHGQPELIAAVIWTRVSAPWWRRRLLRLR
jgi:hypothetical protein